MIDFIQGVLLSIESDSVIVNVNGIGYKIYVIQPDYYKPYLNQSCLIHTHHYFREDWMALYGFKNQEERCLFRLLLNVSGIGPKGALAIIAQSNPNQILHAIADGNEGILVNMPGVGKKTAQRIILDLKDKVKGLNILSHDAKIDRTNNEEKIQDNYDLRNALKALGYQEVEINQAVKNLSNEISAGASIDILIKKSLKILLKE